jgi:stage III sporulation protein AG
MEKKKISLKEIGLPKLIMIFAAGILLILLSFPNFFETKRSVKDSQNKNSQDKNSQIAQKDGNMTSYNTNNYIVEMENKLERILRRVSGIGEVKVMITLKASKEQVTLKDRPYTQEGVNEVDGEGGSRVNNSIKREESTVIVTNGNGDAAPYIIQELEPEVGGVVVIAEGGDDAGLIMDIMEAAEVLFDISVNKVKVMKMKNEINN